MGDFSKLHSTHTTADLVQGKSDAERRSGRIPPFGIAARRRERAHGRRTLSGVRIRASDERSFYEILMPLEDAGMRGESRAHMALNAHPARK